MRKGPLQSAASFVVPREPAGLAVRRQTGLGCRPRSKTGSADAAMPDYTHREMVLIVSAALFSGALTAWAAVYAVQTYNLIGTMLYR